MKSKQRQKAPPSTLTLAMRHYRHLVGSFVIVLAAIGVALFTTFNVAHATIDGEQIECGSLANERSGEMACVLKLAHSESTRLTAIIVAVVALVATIAGVTRVLRTPPPLAKGARVIVRPLGFRDARDAAATIDAEVVAENRLPDDTAAQMQRSVRWIGNTTHLAICSRKTSAIVGIASTVRDVTSLSSCMIGIWIGPGHRNQGFATEAVALLTPSLHETGFEQIRAETAETNVAARRVLVECGFVEEGHRQLLFAADDIVPSVLYRHTVGEHRSATGDDAQSLVGAVVGCGEVAQGAPDGHGELERAE